MAKEEILEQLVQKVVTTAEETQEVDITEMELDSMQQLLDAGEDDLIDVAMTEDVTTTVVIPPPPEIPTPEETRGTEESPREIASEREEGKMAEELVSPEEANATLAKILAEALMSENKGAKGKEKKRGKGLQRPINPDSLEKEREMRLILLQHGGEGQAGVSSGTRILERKMPGDNEIATRSSQLDGDPDWAEYPKMKRRRPTFVPAKLCRNCRKPGHGGKNCPEPLTTYCWRCGRPGRETRDCIPCQEEKKARDP
ncbi:uncharacterized protein LOC107042112 [Diachasma alloeum]|uniref:uncharacterized protein LOC107042112 n=1 Tax=Diachasma alloeum TaxID=454923 RepID=UPI000738179F|nr:uncharacterized protein LOC107042112 [Diachasma alloeum]